jgi:signal transduction histidine kinase
MRILETEKRADISFPGVFFEASVWEAEEWRRLFDALPVPVAVYLPDGSLIAANNEAESSFGLDRLAAKLPDHLHPLVKNAQRLDLYKQGREILINAKDGLNSLPVLLKPIRVRGGAAVLAAGSSKAVPRDVPAASQDHSDGDMELAGEMSRKVKGPLAGIELYASIIGEELDGSGESGLLSLVDEIRFGVREANEYLTSVSAMTEPLKLDLKEVSLSRAADEALKALEGLFKERRIGVLAEHGDLSVTADEPLLIQMFLNILLNACEAMPQGGRLSVAVEKNPQGEAVVSFSDTGPGVDILDVKKLFNPFYTTKKQPLGLGLPVSRRIAEAHQGSVSIGVNDEGGALVRVTLPCIPGENPGGGLN